MEINKRISGVSIIVSTNKEGFFENIISNFENQKWEPKELIIILNKDSLKLEEWRSRTKQFSQVTVFQLPQSLSLGACLNYGVNKAKYEYIAKFDDDDYYGPSYLTEAMGAFRRTNADVVGKRSALLYDLKSKQLRLHFPGREDKWVERVRGGTILAKKRVFSKVKFPDMSLAEDVNFLAQCIKHGFKIYSTSRYNYTYIRRGDGSNTWQPKPKKLERTSIRIKFTDDFKQDVNKNFDTK